MRPLGPEMESANGSISRTLTNEDGELQEPASPDIEETITSERFTKSSKPYSTHFTERMQYIGRIKAM
jgi:hypothetical protein